MRKSKLIPYLLFAAVMVTVAGASVFIYDADAQPVTIDGKMHSDISQVKLEDKASCTPGCHESFVAEKKVVKKPAPVKGSRIFNTSPQLVGKWFKTRSGAPDEPVL
jgi:cytochrome c oxidase assembly protein Cox11